MDDKKVFEEINRLTTEEKALWRKQSEEARVEDADRERLKELSETLDQCWDLLHQRRAARKSGLDPREAKVRDKEQVEGYEG
jgi:hypothetical protein